MRKFVLVFAAICLAACGAATAPPVDLPAPVTGQIDVGTPTEEGKSTITGTEGAVEGGAIVLAVNERIETAASYSPLLKMLDAIVPVAYAATQYPDICNELGHWCVYANDDGSFQMIIDAVIGDSIVIVVIDGWGREISERLSRIIPSTNESLLQPCVDEGVDGSMVDLLSAGSIPIGLYQGDSTKPNRLAISDSETGDERASILLPGCFASQVIMAELPLGDIVIVVTSDRDKFLWVGRWNGEHFSYAKTFTLEKRPVNVSFVGRQAYVAVASKTTSGLSIDRVSLLDGSLASSYIIPNPTLPSPSVLSRVIAMKNIGPFGSLDGSHLVALLMKSEAGHFYLSLLDGSSLFDLSIAPMLLSDILFPALANDITDFAFALNSSREVFMLVANHGEGILHVQNIEGSGIALNKTMPLTNWNYLELHFFQDIPNPYGSNPTKIAIAPDPTGDRTAFILTDGDDLWRLNDFLSTTYTSDNIPLDVDRSFETIEISDDSDREVFLGGGDVEGVILPR